MELKNLEIKRDLINNVAHHYITDKNDGDYFDVYQKLIKIVDEGHGSEYAFKHIDVWDNMEFILVNELIELIDNEVNELLFLIKKYKNM